MDASLFSKLQAGQVAAAHTVGTSLAPKSGAASNVRSALGAAGPTTLKAKAAAANDTGSTSGTSSTSSASATASSATITSSDFLTLLVTELQNQDPTQPTDPNEYITQLVGVNSLEQLVSINSGISSLDTAVTPTTGTTTGTGTGTGTATGSAVPAASVVPAITSAPSQVHRPKAGTILP